MEHDHMIEALAPNGSNHSLYMAAPHLPAPEQTKAARCQATTVSGLTMANAERQSRQRWDRQIHNRQSPEVNLGRFFADL
jgi:hypothetical protein